MYVITTQRKKSIRGREKVLKKKKVKRVNRTRIIDPLLTASGRGMCLANVKGFGQSNQEWVGGCWNDGKGGYGF